MTNFFFPKRQIFEWYFLKEKFFETKKKQVYSTGIEQQPENFIQESEILFTSTGTHFYLRKKI